MPRTTPLSEHDASRRQESLDRHWLSVSALLEERADLQGVHAMADLIYDAVRWSA